MATKDNLEAAFAGESQANRKYLAFSKKAEEEGRPQVAKLFRAAGAAETVHAHAHFDVLGGVKDTAANVQAAIEGEGYEYKEMYPKFLQDAEAEGNQAAAISIRNALAVERIHHQLYSEAAEAIAGGNDLPAGAIFVCGVCGNTVKGEAPDQCPVCGAAKATFTEVA